MRRIENFRLKQGLRLGWMIALLLGAGCSTAGRLGISRQTWRAMPKSTRHALRAQYEKVNQAWRGLVAKPFDAHHALVVNMSGGKMMVPPFERSVAYRKKQFLIGHGQCREIRFQTLLPLSKSVLMRACYLGNQLILDPSHYHRLDQEDSARMYRHPLWATGLVYPDVSSAGYIHLEGVQVAVRARNHV